MYGSVRGAAGNSGPYRDSQIGKSGNLLWSHSLPWHEHVVVFGDLGAGDFETPSR